MKVVLDTNVLLVSVSGKSASHWLYKALTEGNFDLCYTTEILSEYEEQFSKHWGSSVTTPVLLALLELPNAVPTTVYFHLQLLKDADDNKFVDCAFASGADFLVTEDNDFNLLKTIAFPKIPVVKLNDFKQVLISKNLMPL
jgi:putative PIN family toxin of toxin-antitoxin system